MVTCKEFLFYLLTTNSPAATASGLPDAVDELECSPKLTQTTRLLRSGAMFCYLRPHERFCKRKAFLRPWQKHWTFIRPILKRDTRSQKLDTILFYKPLLFLLSKWHLQPIEPKLEIDMFNRKLFSQRAQTLRHCAFIVLSDSLENTLLLPKNLPFRIWSKNTTKSNWKNAPPQQDCFENSQSRSRICHQPILVPQLSW